ncbi:MULTISPECIES: quaternary amine ABC transporter ATP-binding protein [Brochothrix]|uniref:Quaternary amine transport ATP-binding protein n=1 Tax=Brochothrix thermosphacta TaxID=2756 RepID=A0A1D2KA31_BROTH|nr:MULTISPECIES: glycine betaine/L-proline ABC transporter ATP-binding protein [Brochothrix]SLN05808.1 Glycine betaine ABC transport system, ATP-binding protein OpuAA [Brachybacterium faecium]ANZ95473.1 glycine betaine/L-proline ABC transporter ATP-binding protein [Brochothrix thermosphacta]ANZ96255.1 glycine betaine/L-proline ABC transporter ATP-binding protein [Brochothrix thermosphacta]ATF25672.1 glycine betaine/L-proline ABC transporter ATP-binding protein [Brochothrix thermosphacta]ATH850
MSKFEVKNLTKVFGKNSTKALSLLDDKLSKSEILKQTGATVGVNKVSFDVEEGEIFVIMGLSGSGKSTLIRLLNQLIEPTSGAMLLDGENLATMTKKELIEVRRKKMSMVFQNFGLFPNRTIQKNVEFGLEIQGIDKEERFKNAEKALKTVGLEGYGEQYPNQLSGGMQQRVGLARALANNPDVLLMDEAFSALDPLNRKDMQEQLIELQADLKKTIIFITHDLHEALRIGDRIMIMRDGSVVQIGTPEEILMNPANTYVEEFTEDVDRSKVLTAENVMIRPTTIDIDRRGPRFALKLMGEEGLSSVFVTRRHKLIGIVHALEVSEFIKKGEGEFEDIIHGDIPTTSSDTPVTDLIDEMSTSPVPLAVLKDEKFIGIVIRGSLLAALSGNGGDE